jgi:hypothetical protein
VSGAGRERLAVAALVTLLAARAGSGMVADSSVADEHPHILAGWLYWQSGRFGGGFDNPPLGQLLLALPLQLARLPYAFASDTFLVACRLPVVMALLSLGLVLWRWGRVLGGPAVGLTALAVLAFEPNLVAHGHLATLDALATVAWWGALWAWRTALAGVAAPAAGRARFGLGTPAIAFALLAAAAMWIKFTGLLLYPIAVAIALATPGIPRLRAVVVVAAAFAAAVVAGYAVYGFAPLSGGLPEPLVAGLRGKWEHRDEVRFAYLAGRRSEHGFLAYYAVAILLKTPLALLVAAAWGVTRRMAPVDRAALVIPAVTVVAAFTFVRVDLGLRQVLAAMPALVLCAAVGLVDAARRGRTGRIAAVAAAALGIASVLRTAPQDLAYFNECAGGAAGGHRFLLDSNLAWGQDDARVQRFLAGAAARGESWQVLPDPLVARHGRVAVETNALHNLARTSTRPYEWLRALEPVGFAGYSWRLYAVDAAALAALARSRRDDTGVHAAWAELRAASGDSAGADSVRRAAAAFDHAGIAARVARTALERGDWQTAATWLRAAPRDPEIQSLVEWARLHERWVTADPSAAPGAARELGLWHAERGSIAAALPLLEAAAAARRDDGETQRAWAVALAHAGRWAEAATVLSAPALAAEYATERALCRDLAAADAALARAGDGPVTASTAATVDPALLMELGRAHFESERFAPAARAFAAILARDPGARLALAYLGEMQVRCKLRIVDRTFAPLRIVPRRGAS